MSTCRVIITGQHPPQHDRPFDDGIKRRFCRALLHIGDTTSSILPHPKPRLCRRRFQACPDQLEAAGHAGAKKLFDVVAPPLHQITGTTLLDNGRFRCANGILGRRPSFACKTLVHVHCSLCTSLPTVCPQTTSLLWSDPRAAHLLPHGRCRHVQATTIASAAC
jgi:hypothetical protein